MAEPSEPRAGKRGGRRGPLMVSHSSGRKTPFLRGMLTHDLVQRGLSFDDAYAAAHAVRDRLAERAEISTAELDEVLQQQLEEMLGVDVARGLPAPVRREPELTVTFRGDNPQPFSRGLLATSMYAAGVDLDRAYRLVSRLQQQLRREGVQSLDSDELSRRVGDLLERSQEAEVASRYRVLRAIRRLPRPLVLYLAGATGAGKSTLALQLAPLLRIYRVNSTDTIRQVMRMIFSPAILPSLHRSSFELASPEEIGLLAGPPGASVDSDLRRRVIASFDEQATRVLVGVRAVVERSVAENVSVLVEGVHLMPPLVPFLDLEGAAHQILLVLTTLDEEVHRSRFLARGPLGSRRAERYLENFTAIRLIQEHLLQHAEARDVPLIDTTELESVLERTLRVITGVLQRQVPRLAEGSARVEMPPVLLVILDGML